MSKQEKISFSVYCVRASVGSVGIVISFGMALGILLTRL